MNFNRFESYMKEHRILSIPLIVAFLLTIFFSFTDAYTKINSFFSKEYNLNIELLQIDNNYIHVNSVTSRKDPYISSIGSWYKFRLTNNGKNPYSIINILYKDKQHIESFQNYYLDKNVIYLSGHTSLPKNINNNESIELYIFIPFKINKKLGNKLFPLLYTKDDKLDTLVELYLFGNQPMIQKATIPRYDNDKFVGTVSIDVEVTNWDEYFAPRDLYSKMDRKNDIFPFDYDMKDGFSYKEKNELLSQIVKPTVEKINMNNIYENEENDISIVFEINNHKKFRKDLYVDSTGLLLTDEI